MKQESSLYTDIYSEADKLTQEMLDLTIKCAEINSGSFNQDGVNKTLKEYKLAFEQIKTEIGIQEFAVKPLEIINAKGNADPMPLGNALSIIKTSSDSKNNNNVKVLFAGHLDTVFAKDHSFQKVKFIDANTINGPGVADMKGGISVILYALKLFEQTEFSNKLDWEVLLTPDEEVGSWGSAELLEKSAKRNHVGLIFEPSIDDIGTFAGQRKGSGDFTIISRGLASHAGRNFYDGKNAILAISKIIQNIHALNGKRDDVTINIGKIVGGEAINIVPDLCVAKLGTRYPKVEDETWIRNNIQSILDNVAKDTGVKFELIGGFSRKPKHIINDTAKLYELVREVGKSFGLPVKWESTGGCCDGNNLYSHGLPNIDTLGVRGAKIHSSDEYMLIDSLSERLKLTLGILIKLSTDWQTCT